MDKIKEYFNWFNEETSPSDWDAVTIVFSVFIIGIIVCVYAIIKHPISALLLVFVFIGAAVYKNITRFMKRNEK